MDTSYPFVEAYSPDVNLPIVDQAADSAGYFNMFPDLDGAVRWILLIIKCGMVQELEGLNKKRASQRKQPLDVGIGINTNPVVVGNMGVGEII
jgi:class 3 adenylate cyclase